MFSLVLVYMPFCQYRIVDTSLTKNYSFVSLKQDSKG